MVRTGPDGGLWVADMYRQVIEHPQWVPAEAQRKLDLYAGGNMGRIYRVVAADRPKETDKDRQYFDKPASEVSSADLIGRLGSPNGWWRDTAHRLLLHRGPDAITIETLKAHLANHPSPLTRLHILCLLSELAPDDSEAIRAGLLDTHPGVERHAVRLSERLIGSDEGLRNDILRLTASEDPHLALQIAHLLSVLPPPIPEETLPAFLNRNQGNLEITSVALNAVDENEVTGVIDSLAKVERQHGIRLSDDILKKLWSIAGQQLGQERLGNFVRERFTQKQMETARSIDFACMAEFLKRIRRRSGLWQALAQQPDLSDKLRLPLASARQTFANRTRPEADRLAGLRLMSVHPEFSDADIRFIARQLTPEESPAMQRQAVAALVDSGRSSVAPVLLSAWKTHSPDIRASILDALLSRSAWAAAVVDAVRQHRISTTELGATARERLLSHRDENVRNQAKQILSITPTVRSAVVDEYRTKLSDLSGSPAAGKPVFEKRCGVCHRLQGIGKKIGADLTALKDRSANALLAAILDPNRAVETKFLSYTAVTTEGLTHSGMLLRETGNSITLLGTDGKEKVIARTDIDDLVCSNRSLMPEGLEKDLSAQDLADVIAFVQSSAGQWKSFAGNHPQLISADQQGTLILPAENAEIYGPTLVFEDKYANLGWWQSTEDYAIWNINVPQSGFWTVEIDYACDSGTAGNLLKLSTDNRLLSVRVPGTGTWDEYRTWTAGKIDLGRGQRKLIVSAPEKPTSALIDLRTIRLIPPQ